MNQGLIDQVVQAVLYEGYILYPYRRSTKNQQRWTFGGIFPREYSESVGGAEPCCMQAQCLLRACPHLEIGVKVGFLQLVDRRVTSLAFEPMEQVEIGGTLYQSWQEAIERTISVTLRLPETSQRHEFQFTADRELEALRDADGEPAAMLIRNRSEVKGSIEVAIRPVPADLFELTVQVVNQTPVGGASGISREEALSHSMASTHVVLSARAGEFVSLIDPPQDLADISRQCTNIGCWPVLVGEAGSTDAMLAAPIILYDYPQLAPQSPGDLFDGTEIDEILSLRILTLTEDEKLAARSLDDRVASMIQRTESLAREELARLHGTIHRVKQRPDSGTDSGTDGPDGHRRVVEAVHLGGSELRVGDSVCLRPRRTADPFDIILNGRIATIVAIEQDYENRIHLAVTIDDDPGADIGAAGKIGHRFFYGLDEVEPIPQPQEAPDP